MSAEKVRKKKKEKETGKVCHFLDFLLFVVEPCLRILGGIFIT